MRRFEVTSILLDGANCSKETDDVKRNLHISSMAMPPNKEGGFKMSSLRTWEDKTPTHLRIRSNVAIIYGGKHG